MNVHRTTQKSPVLLSKHALDVQGTIGRNAVIIGKRSCTCTIFLFAANSQNNIRTCSKHCGALKMWGREKDKHLILFYQKGPGISQADASILSNACACWLAQLATCCCQALRRVLCDYSTVSTNSITGLHIQLSTCEAAANAEEHRVTFSFGCIVVCCC